ncbi:MAG: YigZ family protein [Lachnospiraceae bacterium]|nr:YigZ family protein [Lachnospiraceae bacterium]
MSRPDSYLTILKAGEGEIEEKASRFLGLAAPVKSEAEAEEILTSVRKAHYKARHHCYAFILGEDGARRRSSDDGEPSGTAGLPILNVIDGSGCTDTLIVVTRYFGGTLLGTGGLVRAYTRAAQEALNATEIVEMCACVQMQVTIPYTDHDRVQYALQQAERNEEGKRRLRTSEPVYTDTVTLSVTVRENEAAFLQTLLTQETSGRAVFQLSTPEFLAL